MTAVVYPVTNLKRAEELSIARGEGVYVYDTEGRRYLEGLAGLWCSALGYGNEEMIEAIAAQLRTLSYSHMFGGRTHPAGIELAERLAGMVPVDDARIFFANSGSEANDSQIKMLRYYFNVAGRPKKKKIIAFTRSYHGVTLAAAALTGLEVMHTHFDVPAEALGVLRAESPHHYRGARDGESEEEFTARLMAELEETILREGPETIAAFVAEPVGGAAGVVVPPEGYFPALSGLLERHGILLWADEVICGFGRTGSDFGSNAMGLRPRLMSLAKQLSSAYIPISAAVVPGFMHDAIAEASDRLGLFGHGFTYSGHPVAAAAALKALEIYRRERLFERAAETGRRMQRRLREFAEHPLVGEVRGRGLIAAVELVANRERREAFPDGRVGAAAKRFCQDEGLLVRAVAGNSVAFCPPLVITAEQIDEMAAMFGRALGRTLDFAKKENLLT